MCNFFKNLSSVAILILLVFLCFAFALSSNDSSKKIETNSKSTNAVKLFCTKNEGEYLLINRKDGSKFGVCNFKDGSSCTETDFFEEKCKRKSPEAPENTADFEDVKIFEITCNKASECEIPKEFMTRSDCPYESRCLENKCAVVCPLSQPL